MAEQSVPFLEFVFFICAANLPNLFFALFCCYRSQKNYELLAMRSYLVYMLGINEHFDDFSFNFIGILQLNHWQRLIRFLHTSVDFDPYNDSTAFLITAQRSANFTLKG